jgi:hypothetical protein
MILGMGTRGLTSKQRRFAELLAGGSTKAGAFREAYPSDRRGKGTEWEGAKRVARLPQVAAEVQRLTLLHSPHDLQAQADHIAARLLELSKSQEPAVALRAIAQWGKLAEAGLLKPPTVAAPDSDVAGRQSERARILDDLRRLYEKALGTKGQRRNELLGSSTGSIQENYCHALYDSAAHGEPPAISAIVEESLQSLPEPPGDQDRAGGPIPPEVLLDAAPETLKPGNYELVPIPGRFPTQFRRVPRQG